MSEIIQANVLILFSFAEIRNIFLIIMIIMIFHRSHPTQDSIIQKFSQIVLKSSRTKIFNNWLIIKPTLNGP